MDFSHRNPEALARRRPVRRQVTSRDFTIVPNAGLNNSVKPQENETPRFKNIHLSTPGSSQSDSDTISPLPFYSLPSNPEAQQISPSSTPSITPNATPILSSVKSPFSATSVSPASSSRLPQMPSPAPQFYSPAPQVPSPSPLKIPSQSPQLASPLKQRSAHSFSPPHSATPQAHPYPHLQQLQIQTSQSPLSSVNSSAVSSPLSAFSDADESPRGQTSFSGSNFASSSTSTFGQQQERVNKRKLLEETGEAQLISIQRFGGKKKVNEIDVIMSTISKTIADYQEQVGSTIPELETFEKSIELELLNQNELVDEKYLLELANSKANTKKAHLRKSLLSIQTRRNAIKGEIEVLKEESSKAEQQRKKTDELHGFLTELETLKEKHGDKKKIPNNHQVNTLSQLECLVTSLKTVTSGIKSIPNTTRVLKNFSNFLDEL